MVAGGGGPPGGTWASKRIGILMSKCKSPGSTLPRRRKQSFLSLSPLPPLIIPEASRTQRSPAVNTGTLATPDPEGTTDLVPLLLPPLADEAAEVPDHSPNQIRALTDVGEQLEPIRGEASWRVMSQMSPAPARGLEGKMPNEEANGHPPPPFGNQSHTVQKPVSASTRRGGLLWGRVCALICGLVWASSPLIGTPVWGQHYSSGPGERNIHLPSLGSELHAAPPVLKIFFSFHHSHHLSSLEILAGRPACKRVGN